jgi:tetratricopeptide (TPR) repeat protein
VTERKPVARREPNVASTGGRSARSLNAEGFALLRRGRYAEAEEPLRAAVRLKSDYAYALYNLGWSLLEQGKAREAIEPLRDAAALQPNRWEPLQKLSEAYSQIGNRDLAFEARAKAREIKGDRRERRTRANPVRGARMAVRTMLGDAAWVGSTNRREDQYLQERQDFQLRQTAKADDR